MLTDQDYEDLRVLVFSGSYPGYRPEVKEIPNGDGKTDTGKRYAHVAEKYVELMNPGMRQTSLRYFLTKAHKEALRVAVQLDLPPRFFPAYEHGCLRVLEYPPGTGSETHTDFDLFTLNLYRNVPNPGLGSLGDLHIGELGEIVGLGPATPHCVHPTPSVQRSIVYFAIPAHSEAMPYRDLGGPAPVRRTVGEWLTERLARSRVYG